MRIASQPDRPALILLNKYEKAYDCPLLPSPWRGVLRLLMTQEPVLERLLQQLGMQLRGKVPDALQQACG